MKTCQKCGALNADSDKLCNECHSPLQQAGGKTCPSGRHTMDPTWTECAYCKQENAVPAPPPQVAAVRTPTMWEGQVPPRAVQGGLGTRKEDTPLPPRPQRPSGGPPSPPPLSVPLAQGRQRAHTVYSPVNTPAPGAGKSAPQVTSDRKIVGILVTYSWIPEGQIFPVREGRNFIGRDEDCEICIPNDQTLSGRNSHITFRQNFVIGDMVSMTGTDVDGVPIEEQFRSLANYSTVRAGSTYFTFIAIAPTVAQTGSDPA